MEFAGTERVTTDPAPTMQLSPTLTPADKAILADSGMRAQVAGHVVAQDSCIKCDITKGTDVNACRIGQVELCRQGHFNRRVKIQTPDLSKQKTAHAYKKAPNHF
jgi:hypothetical protein